MSGMLTDYATEALADPSSFFVITYFQNWKQSFIEYFTWKNKPRFMKIQLFLKNW